MKKGIYNTLLFFVVFGFSFCQNKEASTASQTEVTSSETTTPTAPAAPVNELPNLPLTKVDQSQMNAKEIKGKAVLIFFEPDCDHCQREAKEMQKYLPAFANYTVCFFSPAPMDQMQRFFMEYNLSGPNIFFAQTPNNLILQELGAIPAPSVYIYSEQGKLVKAFKGETPMQNIVALL